MTENNNELMAQLDAVDEEYRESLKRFHEVSDRRNQLQRMAVLPKYEKNIGKYYKKPAIVIDTEDELARYRYIKITGAVYDGSGFMDTPKNVGIEFGLDLKGRMMFFPQEEIRLNADYEEITEDEFKEKFNEFVNILNNFKI